MLVLLISLLLFDILLEIATFESDETFWCLRHLSCYKKRFPLELNVASLFLLKVILLFF